MKISDYDHLIGLAGKQIWRYKLVRTTVRFVLPFVLGFAPVFTLVYLHEQGAYVSRWGDFFKPIILGAAAGTALAADNIVSNILKDLILWPLYSLFLRRSQLRRACIIVLSEAFDGFNTVDPSGMSYPLEIEMRHPKKSFTVKLNKRSADDAGGYFQFITVIEGSKLNYDEGFSVQGGRFDEPGDQKDLGYYFVSKHI